MVTGCTKSTFYLFFPALFLILAKKCTRGSNGIRVRGDLLVHSRASIRNVSGLTDALALGELRVDAHARSIPFSSVLAWRCFITRDRQGGVAGQIFGTSSSLSLSSWRPLSRETKFSGRPSVIHCRVAHSLSFLAMFCRGGRSFLAGCLPALPWCGSVWSPIRFICVTWRSTRPSNPPCKSTPLWPA